MSHQRSRSPRNGTRNIREQSTDDYRRQKQSDNQRQIVQLRGHPSSSHSRSRDHHRDNSHLPQTRTIDRNQIGYSRSPRENLDYGGDYERGFDHQEHSPQHEERYRIEARPYRRNQNYHASSHQSRSPLNHYRSQTPNKMPRNRNYSPFQKAGRDEIPKTRVINNPRNRRILEKSFVSPTKQTEEMKKDYYFNDSAHPSTSHRYKNSSQMGRFYSPDQETSANFEPKFQGHVRSFQIDSDYNSNEGSQQQKQSQQQSFRGYTRAFSPHNIHMSRNGQYAYSNRREDYSDFHPQGEYGVNAYPLNNSRRGDKEKERSYIDNSNSYGPWQKQVECPEYYQQQQSQRYVNSGRKY